MIKQSEKIMNAVIYGNPDGYPNMKSGKWDNTPIFEDHDCHLTLAGEDGCEHPSHKQI